MSNKRIEAPPPHELGAPLRPPGLARAARNAWNALLGELAGKLYQDEGPLLLELIQPVAEMSRLAGAALPSYSPNLRSAQQSSQAPTSEFGEAISETASFGATAADLDGFLAAVKRERATFGGSLKPRSTKPQMPRLRQQRAVPWLVRRVNQHPSLRELLKKTPELQIRTLAIRSMR